MSTHHVAALLLADFEMFARVAYRHLHGGFELGHELYISYICRRLTKATQLGARTALNLPPRHLKTLTAAVFLSAWLLARDPTEKIIIVTYNEQLALYIAYLVRKIIRSPWFQKYFLTRLADDRTRVGDFATTAGGGVFAVSVDGAITGRGASFIIFDDPVAIADSANSQKLEQVNERFDGEIMSRLNEPRAGRVLITQHRLHPNDLTGHVLETGGWDHIGLPFIAPKDQEYDLDGRLWYRKKGELLRPDAFTAADIDRIRAIINPDFEALYQQYMGESSSVRICRGSFGTFILAPPDAPVIISVDPGHRSGPGHSFTVMQALCWAGEEVFLLDQWRAQSDVAQHAEP